MGLLDTLNEIETELDEREAGKAEPVVEETPAVQEPEPVKEEPKEEPAEQEGEDDPAPVDAKEANKRGYQKRKETSELKEQVARLEGQLATMLAMQKPAEPAKVAQAPNPQEDPDGYIAHELNETRKQTKAVADQVASIALQNQYNAAKSHLDQLGNDYSATKPDYKDVIKHATDFEFNKTMALNPSADPAQVRANLEVEIVHMGLKAHKAGLNPAAAIYEQLSKAYGYQPKAPAVSSEKANFAKVQQNRQRSASGQSAGGAVGTPSLTSEKALKMTPREFSKLSDAEVKSLFGG